MDQNGNESSDKELHQTMPKQENAELFLSLPLNSSSPQPLCPSKITITTAVDKKPIVIVIQDAAASCILSMNNAGAVGRINSSSHIYSPDELFSISSSLSIIADEVMSMANKEAKKKNIELSNGNIHASNMKVHTTNGKLDVTKSEKKKDAGESCQPDSKGTSAKTQETQSSPASGATSDDTHHDQSEHDDDDASCSSSSCTNSMSTLLSISSNEDSTFCTKGQNLTCKFHQRHEFLSKLQDQNLKNLLLENEAAVQQEALSLLTRRRLLQKKKRTKEEDGDDDDNDENEPIPNEIDVPKKQKSTITDSIRRSLLFEYYHTLPGIFGMVIYCLAHQTVYESIYNFYYELIVGNFAKAGHEHHFFNFLIFMGLFLGRLSGDIFLFISEDAYCTAKFDMHNRLRRGAWDASIMRWIRKRRTLHTIISVFSVYFWYIGTGFYLHKALPTLMDVRMDVLETLPSVVWKKKKAMDDDGDGSAGLGEGSFALCEYDDFATPVFQWIITGHLSLTNQTPKSCSRIDDEEEQHEDDEDYDKLIAELGIEDERYLYSKLSMTSFYTLMGDATAGLVSARDTFLFNGVVALGTLYILKRLDVPFW